ncbi:GPI inositol-deacylase isoform 2-T2 [Liasis olivaceus]
MADRKAPLTPEENAGTVVDLLNVAEARPSSMAPPRLPRLLAGVARRIQGRGGPGGEVAAAVGNMWRAGRAAGVLFHAVLAALVLLGARDVFFQYEENRCSMTYMFEYPEYLKIKLPKKISRRYPVYELYLYGEGIYAEENRKRILTGIPILFLPGNAGSYKQVRSLGSIALRKAEDTDFKYHFDVFSVNFNEELVALYGGSLQRQTRFVHECIKIILKLYKGHVFAPRSVALVGHSMGGLVARALLTLKHFKPELLSILVTQATPHIAPVLPFDQYLTDFYKAVNHNWIQRAQEIRNLTTLSVAGGFRDYQVRSGLASLPRSRQNCALSVVSSAVPRVWVSTDHLSIVWCKELILATVRAFFDLIDENTKQISENPKRKLLVLNHHFLRNPGKLFEEKPQSLTELTGVFIWIKIKTSKWSYKGYNESDGKYFIFSLSSHRKSYTHIHCQNSMLDTNSWIYGCANSTSSKCLQAVDLTWKAELLPTVKIVTLKLQDYPSLTHIVLHIPVVGGNKFTLDCEFFNEVSRTAQLPVTNLFTFGFSSSKIKLNSTGLIHIVQLQHFGQIYQAFKIFIQSNCQILKERKPSVYQLHIPWSHEDSLTLSQSPLTEISAKLHIAQPKNDTSVPLLKMYSSSDCQYEVIRIHCGTLPMYIISNILLAYRRQLKSLMSTGQCSDFVPALTKAAKPYKVEPLAYMIKFLLGLNWFKGIRNSELDGVTMNNQDLWFPLVSLTLFMFGTGIAYWGGVLLDWSIRLLSSLHLVLTRPCGPPSHNSLITRLRFCIAVSMFFLSWTTCGALAIMMTYFHYIFKVVNFHSNLRSELNVSPKNPEPSSNDSKNEAGETDRSKDCPSEARNSHSTTMTTDSIIDSLKMHITVINLLTWIVLLSCPSLMYWLKDIRYRIRLDPDPCRPVAVILIVILGVLMNTSTAKIKSSKLLKIAAYFPLLCSVAAVVFAPVYLYLMPYFVIIPLFLHSLCSIV